MTILETLRWLNERDDFLILTHVRPDGDTLGSAAALCRALREAGKKAAVFYNPQITRRYAPYLEPYWTNSAECGYVISVDIASEGLFFKNAEQFIGRVDLAIDHHPSNSGFAKNLLLDGSCAACGEIVYELVLAMNGRISEETATLAFIAVTTDTGCFRYGNTTANTYRVASELVRAGAPGTELNKKFFRTKTRARVDIEAFMLNNLHYTRGHSVATATVTRKLIDDTGADEDDLEDIASIHGQIEGVAVSITIREQLDGSSKISVRTNGTVDANAVCSTVGGGGHKMAAGATLKCGVTEARDKILAAVDAVMG